MMIKTQYRLILIAAIAVFSSGCNQPLNNDKAAETEISEGESAIIKEYKSIDRTIVTGNWIRTDAEYRLEISELYVNGKIKAGYFNPSSINVADTRWSTRDSILNIYIELRDVNYPGSKYNLYYIQDKDMLAGEYFQAVEGNTYKVQFARIK
ncbi:hypothetical protein [Flavitalea sp.]|nr:hypothetical protein [Flavitalea sp.]